MLIIATTTLRILKQTKMFLNSNWLVSLSKLRRIMQTLRHLKAYWVYHFETN